MMTNKEFYSDKLLAALIIVSSCQSTYYYVFGKNCTGENCRDCEFSNMESIENWLNAEHVEPEPPLLENGDGLKPGDWIMVRDYRSLPWKKKMFVAYYDGEFWTAKGDDGRMYTGTQIDSWTYARLPMEGE